MRILMLIDRLDIGGAETHVLTLAAALQRTGAQVTVLSFGGTLESKLRADGVRCLHFPAPMSSGIGCLRNLAFLRRLVRRSRYDVIHAHTRRCALLLRLLPRLATKSAAAPWQCYRLRSVRRALAPLRVVTAHAAFAPRFSRLSYWGEATLAVSEDIRTHLRRHFGVTHPVRVLPNGVELAHAMPEKEQSVFSIVFASRMDADCSLGGELLLRIAPLLWAEAAKRGKALRICLLGGGNDCHRLRLLWSAACAAHPALSQIDVTLPGGVEDVRPYLAAAQVFVGVSRAALEALSEGCSVVLAGNEGYGGLLTPQSFAEHAATNFCCRGREKLSEAAVLQDLRRLLDEGEAERRARTDALVSLLRRHYDIDTLAAKTLRFYSGALSQKRQLRLLCAGYFGRGNLGDEAILRCLMRRFDGAAAPGSLADAPWYTAPRGKVWMPHIYRSRTGSAYHARRMLWIGRKAWVREGVSSVAAPSLRLRLCALDRRRVLAAFGQLLHSDALLLGGGSLLQNGSRHGNLSLLYYLALCTVARLCGCPFSLRANGAGPLRGWWARWAVALTLRGASGISLRDVDSRRQLACLGVPEERLTLLEDGVAAWRARCTLPVRRGNYVCICPRGGDLSDMSQLLSLAQRCAPGCPVVYVALDAQQDILGCAVLAALFPGRMVCPGSEREAAALLGGAAMVVSMRLHGLILAGKAPGRIALATQASADKLVAEVGGKNVEKINKKFQKKAIQTPKNIV